MASSSPYLKSLSTFLHHSKTSSQILQIHAQSITNPSPTPLNLLFALSKLPTPSPLPHYPHLLFSQIPNPNTFAYNTLIRLSAPRASLRSFLSMRRNRVRPDSYTYPFLLKACASLLPSKELPVAAVHGESLRTGFASDAFTVNSLIASYCRTGDVASARKLFDGFTHRDLVSWNSMIAGCVGFGDLDGAQKLFDVMPVRDAFSWAVLIDGYGKGAAAGGGVARARELFDRAEEEAKDSACWNSMVGAYCRAGDMGSARELFESMPRRNVISWSVMIDGYVSHGDPEEGLELFRRMLRQGVTKPDRVSAVGAIAACAQLGALDQGRWVHSYLERNGVPFDVVVGTSLVDMYMKCGSLELARRVFEGMRERNVVTWNAMIVGLGTNGRGAEAVELFFEMRKEGVPTDDLTLLGVLTACVHGGFVEEGLEIFDEFGGSPKVEHYGCVVDLLGRAGRLEEAKDVIERMRVEPTPALWGSLLAACRTHRRVGLAEHAVERLAGLGADDSGVYVLLSNVYAEAGAWDGVWRTRRLMEERGMRKETGRSVIELDGSVHEFINGDCSHPSKKKIFRVLQGLYNLMVSN
ncbi:pentatricopeptide repeat-containing protein-like [Iris pallida]|uniref:Pentatricopeptide repeat-containing protein-like n=1 Tax=Iris pallida TaxID=29817 RepID=A0AAX6I9C1_IRIPA|nr:pentatricopeptide repeat-containing protein-like [Iris pallida]